MIATSLKWVATFSLWIRMDIFPALWLALFQLSAHWCYMTDCSAVVLYIGVGISHSGHSVGCLVFYVQKGTHGAAGIFAPFIDSFSWWSALLQIALGAVIIAGFVQNLVFALDYLVYNYTGTICILSFTAYIIHSLHFFNDAQHWHSMCFRCCFWASKRL